MKINKITFYAAALSLIATGTAFSSFYSKKNSASFGSNAWVNQETNILSAQASNIDRKVLRLSLKAYSKARRKGLDKKQILTVIDYSKPSTAKRLWVFDVKRGKTLINTLVSHGKNSGRSKYATSFSNVNGSKKSSLGVFLTAAPYVGGHGISLRMNGLERGINDNAYKRTIVFHGAKYMSQAFVNARGRGGLSWGCPAVAPGKIKTLVDTIKGNTLVFAYYPDQNWLKHSKFLA